MKVDLPNFQGSGESSAPESQSCAHCGGTMPRNALSKFCCGGCESVFLWIQSHELGAYYDLKSKTQSKRRVLPVAQTSESFGYLDDPEFRRDYSWTDAAGKSSIEFYLEGVHCAGCVWLTEKVAERIPGVERIQLNLGNSVATVQIDSQGSFAAVAAEFEKLGYRPHPVQPDQRNELRQKENRLLLIRLGVAAACAGNIMLLAVSVYGGAEGVLAERFRWLCFFLFLPVFSFSAVPFYQTAWTAIRARSLSIDIPVVLGILLGSFVSMINLIQGDDRQYFDSLAMLVFLLLSTRYLLRRTQQSALDSSRLVHFLTPSRAKKWNSDLGAYQEMKVEQIRAGDRIQVLPHEVLPVDGVVLHGATFLDGSLLSGESRPLKAGPGDVVFAGMMNLDSPMEVEVTRSGRESRVGSILESMERVIAKRAPIAVFTDRVSRVFIGAVVILAGAVFGYGIFSGDWHDSLNRALAVSIVTCPCTFALITPLAFSLTLGKLARVGILVKGVDVLERLCGIRRIFLDKTGTLTRGEPEVIHWGVPEEYSAVILALESYSRHPIAQALVEYLRPRVTEPSPGVDEIREVGGVGISGRWKGERWEIRRSENPDAQGTEVSAFRDGVLLGSIRLQDSIRSDSKNAIDRLRSMAFEPWILSGDHRSAVDEVANALEIPTSRALSETSPEEKRSVIERHSPALMVGDGANDAIALAQAEVGIAVHSGVEMSLRAADIYIRVPGVQPICDLIVIARETLNLVKRNLWVSVFYNAIAGGLAVTGNINPLAAAILMPVSAFSVFISTSIGTREMRRAFRRFSV